MVVNPYPVEGSVCSLEGHVVRNQAQVSLVYLDAVHVEHTGNLLNDGLTRRLDPVVLGHVMDVITGKLLNVENSIEVENVVDIDSVSLEDLPSLVLQNESPFDVLDLVDHSLVGGEPKNLAHVDPLLSDVEGEGDRGPGLLLSVEAVVNDAGHAAPALQQPQDRRPPL